MDKVREKLLSVEKLIGNWGLSGVDELERDAVLKTLQDVYTAVKNVPVRDAKLDVDAYVNAYANRYANADVKTAPEEVKEVVKEEPKPKIKPSIVHSLYGELSEKPREDAYVNDDVNRYASGEIENAPKEDEDTYADTYASGAENRYANTYANGDTATPPEPVDNKARSLHCFIAINDRAMMIRTLFKGDEAAFDVAVERLDGFNYLDDAVIFIHDNWQWGADNEGARRLIEILEQKLG